MRDRHSQRLLTHVQGSSQRLVPARQLAQREGRALGARGYSGSGPRIAGFPSIEIPLNPTPLGYDMNDSICARRP